VSPNLIRTIRMFIETKSVQFNDKDASA